MLGIVLDDVLRLVLDYPRPVPAPGEALVRVRLAGVCATDLEILRGYKGFRGGLGHEFVGEVVASESGGKAWLGRRGALKVLIDTVALAI